MLLSKSLCECDHILSMEAYFHACASKFWEDVCYPWSDSYLLKPDISEIHYAQYIIKYLSYQHVMSSVKEIYVWPSDSNHATRQVCGLPWVRMLMWPLKFLSIPGSNGEYISSIMWIFWHFLRVNLFFKQCIKIFNFCNWYCLKFTLCEKKNHVNEQNAMHLNKKGNKLWWKEVKFYHPQQKGK